ncbi:DNA methyltransferase [Rhodovulum sp. BSW8]|uniref:DNA cytosine methyltransferase n=1 Tax=Rhodovulum sp. BSW8 TaxID=2259645 RepID=UPI000DE4A47D|nr:DNA cytosine methyltransferase [Rhodovulum sp. BSW8]RBO52640.1 DNA methyltransferase [Rhodovulum sp. BSW8]
MPDGALFPVEPATRTPFDPTPMIVDSFAGGGGASTGIEMALGRSPDVAINHDAAALALHQANHPATHHLNSNVWHVDPAEICRGRRVGLAWFSPDCKHHSKAKGGKPVARNIRDLAWVVVLWARRVRPEVIALENVEEFRDWGPLTEANRPCPERRGQTFRHWVGELRRLGYRVEWRELRACDYGAPTIRKRLFLIARRDGRPIVWPAPTHGDPASPAVRKGRLLPWRSAADCIDWSLPCPSIFDSSAEIKARHGLRAVRPLAKNSLARIARGMRRYVLDAERPFIVNLTHGARTEDLAQPLRTITGAAPLGLLAPAIASIAHGYSGGRREYPVDAPLGTVTSGGNSHAVIVPHLLSLKGTARRAIAIDAPHPTVLASGSHQTPVAAWFAKYYGTGDGARMDEPCHTVTVKDRMGHMQADLAAPPFAEEHEARAREVAEFLRAHGAWDGGAFVTLEIDGQNFVVIDIGMRMLSPRELFNAQGFPSDYVIEGVWDGFDSDEPTFRPFPKDVQISCCGNSVCPPVAAAIIAANCQHLAVPMQAEEANNA